MARGMNRVKSARSGWSHFVYVAIVLFNGAFWLNMSYLGHFTLDAPLKWWADTTASPDGQCTIVAPEVRHATCEEMRAVTQSKHTVPELSFAEPRKFLSYRDEALVKINPHGATTIVNMHKPIACRTFVHATVSKRHSCFALGHIRDDGSGSAYNLLRFHKDKKLGGRLPGGGIIPTGFFRKAANDKGRARLREKMQPFLESFDTTNDGLRSILAARGLKVGDDVVVMVVNDGEADLFFNFACSLSAYGLRHIMRRVLVFSGSAELVPLIKVTGAMAVSHESFGKVSRGASYGYLDSIFVDMMWYKAFSVYLLLRLGYNVLFQDVDLVWFRDPFEYFKRHTRPTKEHQPSAHVNSSNHLGISPYPEAFFSDDGQRTLRYTPFYANSGFYYLLASARTEHFAWSVVTAFDILQATGSHQNVFTMRLLEGLDLTRIHPKLLPLREFATGVMFHHNKTFMTGIQAGTEHPYNFHMCWTANKADKLKNFKATSMWYLSKEADVRALRPPHGKLYKWTKTISGPNDDTRWKTVQKRVCSAMPDAPFQPQL